MQTALERALADAAFGRLPDGDDPLAIRAWAEATGLSGADARRFEAELARWRVYRKLVRGRLRETMTLAMPRSVARLGPLFDEVFERFLAERGPRTHYLRDVTEELLDFWAPLTALDARFPPYALELARHESLRVLVGSTADARTIEPPGELDLERGLGFVASARLVHYEYAVHRLPEDEDDRSEPERRPTWLFVYRSREHEVRYLELTPLCAAILERLLAGASLGGALQAACRARDTPLDQVVVAGTAAVLADLAERGALLGSRLAADLPAPASQSKMRNSQRPEDG